MRHDILQQLHEIQRQAQELQDMVRVLQDHGPRSVDGYDSSRSVRVSIDAHGLPTAIQVDSEWQVRLGPQAIGQAVLEASTAAIVEAVRGWSQALEDSSWASRVAAYEAQQQRRGSGVDGSASRVFPAFSTAVPDTRDPSDMAEDVLRAAGELRRHPRVENVAGAGRDQSGNVSITVSRAGLQECVVQAAWAARQDGHALTAALQIALRAARADLGAREKTPAPGGFDQLVGDALAALRSITATTRRDDR